MPDHRTTAAPAAAPTAGTGVGTTAAALAATLGIAAVAWVVAIRQMDGMDMGPATELGAFGSFAVLWVSMIVMCAKNGWSAFRWFQSVPSKNFCLSAPLTKKLRSVFPAPAAPWTESRGLPVRFAGGGWRLQVK